MAENAPYKAGILDSREEDEMEQLNLFKQAVRQPIIAWGTKHGFSQEWIDETFTFEETIARASLQAHRGEGLWLTRVPQFPNMEVGCLDIGGNEDIRSFSEEFIVKTEAILDQCSSLESLSKGFSQIKRDLILEDCSSLKSLPDELEVGRDLNLMRCTSLTELPRKLWVGGWLDLTGCTSLRFIPQNIEVGVRGTVFMRGCRPEVIQQARQKRNWCDKVNVDYPLDGDGGW